jgi:hypothetical protein
LLASLALIAPNAFASDLEKPDQVEATAAPALPTPIRKARPSMNLIADAESSLRRGRFDLRPTVSPLVLPKAQRKLGRAYALAAGRLAKQPTCRALFDRLGSNGLAMLEETLYLPASRKSEHTICNHAARAYTYVGSDTTMICGNFQDLPDHKAAVLLIHEALHFAGLNDEKHDPHGPSSKEINKLIERACGLRR